MNEALGDEEASIGIRLSHLVCDRVRTDIASNRVVDQYFR